MSKLIKIYGERNTNTRYMEKLIELNLHVEQLPGVVPGYVKTIQKLVPGKEWLRGLFFSATGKHNLGWKHGRVMSVENLKALGVLQREICFVSITKNPYSWLLSLHRKPYSHQFDSSKPDFETFLSKPWKTEDRDNCEDLLESPVVLWNIKNASYMQLADINGLNITTESMFLDPAVVIEKISDHFAIDRKVANFVNYERSTKNVSRNFAYYQDYYLKDKWRDKLSAEAISIINETVNRNLMSYYGYEVLEG